jgi:hypothetical protein
VAGGLGLAPGTGSGWSFAHIREVVVFVLGVAVIIEGLIGTEDPTAELVIGMVMVGVLPLDRLVAMASRGRDR